MHHEPLSQRLSLVKHALAEVEAELVEADVCPDGLEDFKSALDHIRLSTWAVLTAVEAKNFQHSVVLARFRIARLMDMCRSIRSDIAGGLLTSSMPEYQSFCTALDDTREHLAHLADQAA
jgi:hypothetical protein